MTLWTEQERVLIAVSFAAAFKVVEADESGMLKLALEQQAVEVTLVADLLGLDVAVVEAALSNLEEEL